MFRTIGGFEDASGGSNCGRNEDHLLCWVRFPTNCRSRRLSTLAPERAVLLRKRRGKYGRTLLITLTTMVTRMASSTTKTRTIANRANPDLLDQLLLCGSVDQGSTGNRILPEKVGHANNVAFDATHHPLPSLPRTIIIPTRTASPAEMISLQPMPENNGERQGGGETNENPEIFQGGTFFRMVSGATMT